MPAIAIQGIRGGCGTTSIAVGLAGALAAMGKPVLLIDLCPHNLLGLHFGLPLTETQGWAQALAVGSPWEESAYIFKQQISLLPFGKPDSLAKVASLAPAWLAVMLPRLDLPEGTFILLDVPHDTPLREVLMTLPWLHWLTVVETDPICHVLMNQRLMGHAVPIERHHWLINRYQPDFKLSHDLLQLWQSVLAHALAPGVVHADEAVREALACKLPISETAPGSLAAQDFQTLATWCIATMEGA